MGNRDDHALNDSKGKEDTARLALEGMASYQRAAPPSPYKPIMKPAVVRVMWIPDHLNRNGDLVPAHYYYLKVKGEQFNVSDAFELERQLDGPNGSGPASSVPFIYTDSVGR